MKILYVTSLEHLPVIDSLYKMLNIDELHHILDFEFGSRIIERKFIKNEELVHKISPIKFIKNHIGFCSYIKHLTRLENLTIYHLSNCTDLELMYLMRRIGKKAKFIQLNFNIRRNKLIFDQKTKIDYFYFFSKIYNVLYGINSAPASLDGERLICNKGNLCNESITIKYSELDFVNYEKNQTITRKNVFVTGASLLEDETFYNAKELRSFLDKLLNTDNIFIKEHTRAKYFEKTKYDFLYKKRKEIFLNNSINIELFKFVECNIFSFNSSAIKKMAIRDKGNNSFALLGLAFSITDPEIFDPKNFLHLEEPLNNLKTPKNIDDFLFSIKN